MYDSENDIAASDEEMLDSQISDEALENAFGARAGYVTLLYGSYCFTCRSEGNVNQ